MFKMYLILDDKWQDVLFFIWKFDLIEVAYW